MKLLGRAALALVLLTLAAAAYVRLAPVDPARWHVRGADTPAQGVGGAGSVADGSEVGDRREASGFAAVRAMDKPAAEMLAAADRVILATPRTRRIAGSVEEGMITYETRSALWGFPDYTTVWTEDGRIAFHGRLRFGLGDAGVNAARIRGWLTALGLGT